MRFVKKISDRGTLTIPSDVREALDLKDGDLVDVHILGVVARRASGTSSPTPSPSPSRKSPPLETP
jgi:AbrB family looped-hinge helix DNA binding protein